MASRGGSPGRLSVLVDHRLPDHLVHVERLGQSLQFQRTDRPELVAAPPPRHASHHRRAQDLAGGAGRLESLGLDHRQAEAVTVLLDGDVADAQADAHLDPLAVGRPVVPVDGLLDGHGGTDGVGRSRERGHHPVTGRLDDPASGCVDRVAHQTVVGVAQVVGLLLADPGPQSVDPTRSVNRTVSVSTRPPPPLPTMGEGYRYIRDRTGKERVFGTRPWRLPSTSSMTGSSNG